MLYIQVMDAMRKYNKDQYSDVFLMADIDGRSQEEINLELSEREMIDQIEKELKREE
jgi:hypothetical protein